MLDAIPDDKKEFIIDSFAELCSIERTGEPIMFPLMKEIVRVGSTRLYRIGLQSNQQINAGITVDRIPTILHRLWGRYLNEVGKGWYTAYYSTNEAISLVCYIYALMLNMTTHEACDLEVGDIVTMSPDFIISKVDEVLPNMRYGTVWDISHINSMTHPTTYRVLFTNGHDAKNYSLEGKDLLLIKKAHSHVNRTIISDCSGSTKGENLQGEVGSLVRGETGSQQRLKDQEAEVEAVWTDINSQRIHRRERATLGNIEIPTPNLIFGDSKDSN